MEWNLNIYLFKQMTDTQRILNLYFNIQPDMQVRFRDFNAKISINVLYDENRKILTFDFFRKVFCRGLRI